MGFLAAAVAALAMALGSAAQASADVTIGTTTPPSGSSSEPCGSGGLVTWVQTGAAAGGPSYVVPAGGGLITSWSTNTAADKGGTQVSLVVLRPASGGSYTVVAVDAETLPNPLPPVATFTLASPIVVLAGDTIGISPSANNCTWSGGDLTAADTVGIYSSTPPSDVASGQTLTSYGDGGNLRVDVAATVTPSPDLAVTTETAPANPTPGNLALLTSTVTNRGPGSYASTFVDDVPAALTIDSAAAGNGTCGVSGHTVTCTITGLPAGSSTPVDIVVTPPAPGLYTNQATVADPPGQTDPNGADNSATATLDVVNPQPSFAASSQPHPAATAPEHCVVPNLKGIHSREAKRLLKLLGCNVKVKHRRRRGIAQGAVLKTNPGTGTYTFRRTIDLVVAARVRRTHPRRP